MSERPQTMLPEHWKDVPCAECKHLREQLDVAREALAATRLDAEKTYKWRERFEERAIRAEAELRKVTAECERLRADRQAALVDEYQWWYAYISRADENVRSAARAALGVVGEQEQPS